MRDSRHTPYKSALPRSAMPVPGATGATLGITVLSPLSARAKDAKVKGKGKKGDDRIIDLSLYLFK